MRHVPLILGMLAISACTSKSTARQDTAAPATATLAGAPAPDAGVVRQAIKVADSSFAAAVLRGDATSLSALFAEDALVMWPNAAASRGREAIAKSFGAFFAGVQVSVFRYEPQDVIVAGDYAIETGTYEITTRTKDDKSSHDVAKYILVWRRQPDGSYRVVRDIANSDLPAR